MVSDLFYYRILQEEQRAERSRNVHIFLFSAYKYLMRTDICSTNKVKIRVYYSCTLTSLRNDKVYAPLDMSNENKTVYSK